MNRSAPKSPLSRERKFKPDIPAVSVPVNLIDRLERSGQRSFQPFSNRRRQITVERFHDVMRFQSFDYREPVTRLYRDILSCFLPVTARRFG